MIELRIQIMKLENASKGKREREGIFIELKKQLLHEQERLEKIHKKVKQELENAPEGTLRLGKSQGCTQYYHCKKGTTHNGVYIPKREMELVRQLAQKAYDERILRYTENALLKMGRVLKGYEDDGIEKIYLSEHPQKQKLITPVEPTFQQKLERWLTEPYVGKSFGEDAPVIVTNSGIRVRSKSEKIMADYFDSIGLAFKYECPLHLKPYGTIYPDFTFLSRRTGREVYWEHEGMMDNPEYARAAVQKIGLYEMNGIFPGEDLILSFETSTSVLNTVLIKSLTKRYLL